jgi:hypothetical protein
VYLSNLDVAFMTASISSTAMTSALEYHWHQPEQAALLQGNILISTSSHTAWGAAVTASMYLPLERLQVWQQLTNYSRWVQYFPDLTQSHVLDMATVQQNSLQKMKRLYQAASKAFLFLNIQVEIYLKVYETLHQQIKFCLEKGSFQDFSADLNLQDWQTGTILTYSVQATPLIPVPSPFIQQAMHMDLPNNMRQMRKVMCS